MIRAYWAMLALLLGAGAMAVSPAPVSAQEQQEVQIDRSPPPPPSHAPAPRAVPREMPAPRATPQPAPASRAVPRAVPSPGSGVDRPVRAPEVRPSVSEDRGQRVAQRGQRTAPPRSGGDAPARAVPRGSGGSDGGGSSGRVVSGEGSRGTGSGQRAVPRADRPRDDRAVTGAAVPRTRPPYTGPAYPIRGGGYYSYPYWWYRPSYWYGYGALGLGYFYYDPFSLGYYGGYYGAPYYAPGYYGGSGQGVYTQQGEYYGEGRVRLKVKPRDAEVFVDGYYVGVVDDFDGTFQRLTIDAGPRRIEVRKPGYQPLVFDVRIPDGETVTYRGELVPAP